MISVLRSYCTFNRVIWENMKTVRLIETVRLSFFLSRIIKRIEEYHNFFLFSHIFMNFDASKYNIFILGLFLCHNCYEMAIFHIVKVVHY